MKMLSLLAIGVSGLALAACVRPMNRHHALRPISQLSCPQSQGAFDRASVAPDGKSCSYTGPDGSEVQLKLVSFSGDVSSVLDPVDAQMQALLPPPPPVPPNPPSPPASSSGAHHDDVDIDLPGVSIHADDKNANVHVAGLHIDANGQNDSVRINGSGHGRSGHGQFTVDANDYGAVIRARGFGPNIEQSLIRVSKIPGPQGWRTVGYEAVGPKSGPLVVANFQTKADDHDATFGDIKALAWKAARSNG